MVAALMPDLPAPYSSPDLPPKRGSLRILTWNINSVRLRLPLLLDLMKRADPDVVCLQETKTEDVNFPAEPIAKAGFRHQAYHGDKGYNGVAILARVKLDGRDRRWWAGREDSRHVAVEIAGIELHNCYVPAGGDIPDPKENPKFAHKLAFLEELASWGKALKPRKGGRILVGDLNVAPLENDVWSHRQLLDVVSHTPAETERFGRAIAAHHWVDAVRARHPEPQRLYTWWSYRNRDWKLSDRGRRLDHILVTPDLAKRVRATYILRDCRDWEKGSDHVPVAVDLKR
jgi:exodeoxyribonuclease-3